MEENENPSLAKIHIASSHLRSIAIPITPIITNRSLDQLTERKIFLKCENFQQAGSFQSRGILNFILNAMKIDSNIKGFVSKSSADHAIAVAYAGSVVKRPCLIILSSNTSKSTIDSIEFYGGQIIQSELTPLEISQEYDYFLIPSSDHPDIIAGYGTIAVELLDQISNLDAIFIPINNIDLIRGIGLYIKCIHPHIRIYACAQEDHKLDEYLLCRSQQDGKIVYPKRTSSFLEKEIFLVPNILLINTAKFVFEHLKLVVELSSSLSLAAILSQYHRLDSNIRNIAVILTSGNLDFNERLPWQN